MLSLLSIILFNFWFKKEINAINKIDLIISNSIYIILNERLSILKPLVNIGSVNPESL